MERVEAAHRYDISVEHGFAFITDVRNWPKFWPGYVRLAEGSRWGVGGDTARLTIRLLGRERELTMSVREFQQNRLVTYTSKQPGLPDAYHERHFEPDGDGFVYRVVVEYEPRGGVAGFFDRALLARGIRRGSSVHSWPWSGSSAPPRSRTKSDSCTTGDANPRESRAGGRWSACPVARSPPSRARSTERS